jgi:hypothetical protein
MLDLVDLTGDVAVNVVIQLDMNVMHNHDEYMYFQLDIVIDLPREE